MLTYPLNRSRLSVDCVCSRAKNVQLYTTLRLPPLRTTGHTNCANVTQLVSMVENMHAGDFGAPTNSNTCRPGHTRFPLPQNADRSRAQRRMAASEGKLQPVMVTYALSLQLKRSS